MPKSQAAEICRFVVASTILRRDTMNSVKNRTPIVLGPYLRYDAIQKGETMKAFLWLSLPLLSLLAWGTPWTIDKDHSMVNFKIKHLVVSNVPGSIAFTEGTFDIDDSDFTKSKLEAQLDPKSVNTNNTKRDDHLKSPDFLSVKQYPTIKFVSKKIASEDNRYKVLGDLTLHGVTKEITLNCAKPTETIKDPWGGIRRGFSATSRFSRKDFGIIWNKILETGGLTLGEDLDVTVDIELVQMPLIPKKTEKKT